jgi:hypothetical protein
MCNVEIELCCYPLDEKKYYCHIFAVNKHWLIGVLKQGVDLGEFLENYDWTDTNIIYEIAKQDGAIIWEKDDGL